MKRLPLLSLALLALLASAAPAQHVIEQATFPPGAASQPAIAVSLTHYTAIAYRIDGSGSQDAMIGVQLVPTDPNTDEIWPLETVFGPGNHHRICWSREGFVLAYSRGDTVWVHRTDQSSEWDPAPQIFVPGGEVVGLDLWGVPTDAAGHHVYLTVDEDVDPTYELDCRIGFASLGYTGWTALHHVVTDLTQLPNSQLSWTFGPAGPWPVIYFLAGGAGELELFRTDRLDGVWASPVRIPGDGEAGPTSFEAEFDVARSASVGIVGLGPQPTCPCGTIHFLACDVYGDWQAEQDITVPYAYFDWPLSPSIDMGFDDVMHVFWYQRDSDNGLQPQRDRLEYRTYDDGVMTDAGDMFDAMPYQRGIGSRVDVGVVPDGSRSVLAWSKTDTIDGEPQLEQIYMARSAFVSAVPQTAPPRPAVALEAWPNPFNPRVNLALELPVSGPVALDVYDARGRRVRRLFEGSLGEGRHTFVWDGARTPSGVYFAQAVTAGGTVVRKLVLAE